MAEKQTVPVVKPGWKTTEFWTKFIPQLLGMFVLFGWVEPDNAAKLGESFNMIYGGILMAIPEVSYAVSRGIAKHGAPTTQIVVKTPRERKQK